MAVIDAARAAILGASMHKMPERWYELLRERIQVEEHRMRVVKDGDIIDDDRLQEFLTKAHSLDGEMLQVMRQAIAETLARDEVSRPTASASRAYHGALAEFRTASYVD